jgi:hypothetical protein
VFLIQTVVASAHGKPPQLKLKFYLYCHYIIFYWHSQWRIFDRKYNWKKNNN